MKNIHDLSKQDFEELKVSISELNVAKDKLEQQLSEDTVNKAEIEGLRSSISKLTETK